MAQAMVEGAREAGVDAEFVDTPEEAGEWLKREVESGDAVLLKASRGVRLERALEVWMEDDWAIASRWHEIGFERSRLAVP